MNLARFYIYNADDKERRLASPTVSDIAAVGRPVEVTDPLRRTSVQLFETFTLQIEMP